MKILPHVGVELCSKAECERQDVPVTVVNPLFLGSLLGGSSRMLFESKLWNSFAQGETLAAMCSEPHLYQIVQYTGPNEVAASSYSGDGGYDPHKKKRRLTPN